MKKIIVSILLPLLGLASCVEDNGNYDYTALGDFAITGIDPDGYSIVLPEQSRLTIEPTVASPYGESDLEYAWVKTVEQGTDLVQDTIATTRTLEYDITERVGTYPLYFYVRSRTTGQTDHASTIMQVQTLYSQGSYILKETAAGDTDLDLLLDDNRLMPDILAGRYGEPLGGAPRSLGILYDYAMIDPDEHVRKQAHSIGVITQTGEMNILRAFDMYRAFDRSTLFYNEPADVPYKFLCGCQQVNLCLSDKGVYFSGVSSSPVVPVESGMLGLPGAVPAGDHYAWSFMGMGYYFWDATNDRMGWIDAAGKSGPLADAAYGDLSSQNATCVFMGSYKHGIVAVLKSKSGGALTAWSIQPLMVGDMSFFTIEQTAVPPTSKLNAATHITSFENPINSVSPALYFVAEGKVWSYDIAGQTDADTGIVLPAGEVTMLRNFHYDLTSSFNYIAVATANGGNYRIDMYADMNFSAVAKTVTGKGRVKDIGYIGQSVDYGGFMMFPMMTMFGDPRSYTYSK